MAYQYVDHAGNQVTSSTVQKFICNDYRRYIENKINEKTSIKGVYPVEEYFKNLDKVFKL